VVEVNKKHLKIAGIAFGVWYVISRPEGAARLVNNALGGLDSNPRNSTFGRVTRKSDDRRNIQLSLRYSF